MAWQTDVVWKHFKPVDFVCTLCAFDVVFAVHCGTFTARLSMLIKIFSPAVDVKPTRNVPYRSDLSATQNTMPCVPIGYLRPFATSTV